MSIFSWRKMGSCLAPCVRPPSIGSCIRIAEANQEKVLQVVKTDGKVLEFSTPILVRDILVNYSGSGIGLTQEDIEHHLPPGYELKLGNVYYILPSAPVISPVIDVREDQASGGVKKIKVVITKQQLQHLLTKEISVEEVLLGLEQKSSSLDSPRNWKSNLEPIPEGSEYIASECTLQVLDFVLCI
ncbi:PREDICTED: uncharacterized protein LOC105139129 [Populus euphratica]|uniref:Uncharacterized protein LOC105139129 n=1 Tax=Populus euphratica TaxID=75702 RepID=A0AAJ6V9H3_POPEU|nr:PREDICTED: uncharacterized protein LOC105139129 [Populus euphratica]